MSLEPIELSAYLDGELSAAERRRVEARLAVDKDYAAQLRALERTQTMILTLVEQPGFHAALMARVQAGKAVAGLGRRPFARRLAAAAAVLLAATAATGAWFAFAPLREPMSQPPLAITPTQPEAAPEQPFEVAAGDALEAVESGLEGTALPPMQLLGTLLGTEPQAVIRVNETTRSYNVGEEVAPGARLETIERGQVTLEVDGAPVVLAVGSEPPEHPLDVLLGMWRLFDVADFDSPQQLGQPVPGARGGEVYRSPSDTVVITRDGAELTIHVEEGAMIAALASVNGLQVHLSFEGDDFAGELSPDLQVLTLRQVLEPEDVERGLSASGYRLERIDDAEGAEIMARAEAKRQLEEELRAMYRLLKAWVDESGGTLFPPSPNVLPEGEELFASSRERRVRYTAGRSLPGCDRPEFPQYEPAATYPDRLYAYESALRAAGCGSYLWPGTLVTIQHAEHGLEGTLDAWGRVRVEDSRGATPTEIQLAEMRASCANNLKQLAIVIKMYENENPGQLSPPGWVSVYPEYLTDPNVLTSPKDPLGTDSYEYLLPATNLEAFAREIGLLVAEENPASLPVALSELPIALNATDWPDGGRNILYADGHVEYSKDWREMLRVLD